jgi:phage recombination protein Bet
MTDTSRKLTIKDRKKAQPKAQLFFSDAEKATIKQTVAKNLTEPQTNIFFYTAQALGLNPLLNEITAISYAGNLSIQVMRDGFLTIAHRSGKFAGLESGVKVETQGNKEVLIGWAKVYHQDFKVPVYQEAEFDEYTTGKNLWVSKPKTMIKKVAESMALRKAFNVNGVYAPEEMDKEINEVNKDKDSIEEPAEPTPQQLKTLKSLGYEGEEPTTFKEAREEIMKIAGRKKEKNEQA